MIKKWNDFVNEEFVNEPVSNEYIDSRMQELEDIIMDSQEGHQYLAIEWSTEENKLNVIFKNDEGDIEYIFDLDELNIDRINKGDVEYSQKVYSVDEGLDMIEKEIYSYLGISESFDDPTGKRIRLVRMEDPYTTLKPGAEGVVRGVDGIGNILVNWDNGSSLSIVPEVDEFDIIDEGLFDFFKQKVRVGDMLLCKNDCTYNAEYKRLPRIYDFEKGKKYEVIEADKFSVTMQSDVKNFRGEPNKEIFTLSKDKKWNYFPYLWDYFEENSQVRESVGGYPSLEEVENADSTQIMRWQRFLPSPSNDEQIKIINRVFARYIELRDKGDINSNTSKHVGWLK